AEDQKAGYLRCWRLCSRASLHPGIYLLAPADQFAVDEQLRHGLGLRYRTQRPRADSVRQVDLGVFHARLLQLLLGLRAERTAFAGEQRDLVGRFRIRVDVPQQGIGVRHGERVTRFVRLDEHLLDGAV